MVSAGNGVLDVAQAMLLGGHVRVGLEDNLLFEKGVLTTNGSLVELTSLGKRLGSNTGYFPAFNCAS